MAELKEAETIWEVPVDEIQVSEFNVRHEGVTQDLDDLVNSIKKHGQLQAVVLLGEPNHPPYRLIVGQRRLLAHKELKKRTIRAVFLDKPLGKTKGQIKAQAQIRSLAENMHRSELEYKDVAHVVTFLYRALGRDDRKVSRETGMSLQKVRRYIDVEERASEETKKKLRAKKVSPIDVQRALNAVAGDAGKADTFLELMQEQQLTKHEKDRAVEYGQANPNARPKEIIEEAIRPRVEESILVRLPKRVRDGLQKAVDAMNLDPRDVAARALEEWLSSKGFIRD